MASPLLLGLGGLGAIGSLFGGPKPPDFREIEKRFGPDALAKLRSIIFAGIVSDPSFRSALGNVNVQGQQLSQNIDANLARAGLSNSGIGAVGSALGGAASGFSQQQLIGQAGQQAGQQAIDLNTLLSNLFMQSKGMQMQAGSPFQKGGAALLGAIGPALLQPKAMSPLVGGAGAFDMNSYLDSLGPLFK